MDCLKSLSLQYVPYFSMKSDANKVFKINETFLMPPEKLSFWS